MHASTTGLTRSCTLAISLCLMWAGLIAPFSSARAETVVCDAATISVTAADMKAEEMIKAVGTTCGIRMVVRGDLFTEDVFSLQFENMPLRAGLDRVLRTLKIPNYMLNFAGTGTNRRVVEILLVGKGGGERELTPAAAPAVVESKNSPNPAAKAKPQAEKTPAAAGEKTAPEEARDEELQEKYRDILDEVLDAHFENEDNIDPAIVLEMYKQALPENMRDNIPEDVLEELELMAEE